MTENMKETFLGMSNFDHSIDDGFEEELRKAPNAVFGRHAAWDFNARVYFDGECFVSEVYCYGSLVDTIRAETLRMLMEDTNNLYGWK